MLLQDRQIASALLLERNGLRKRVHPPLYAVCNCTVLLSAWMHSEDDRVLTDLLCWSLSLVGFAT